MTQEQIDTLLSLVRNLENEGTKLAENVEWLDQDASDEQVNSTLALGLYNVENAIKNIRQERHDDLLW